MKRSPQQAMALVITLIMLSLITIVAVAFLSLARRERASVTQAANITDSELMADAGRERGIAELAARVCLYITTNGDLIRSNFCSLLVSTNWDIDTNGWVGLTNDARAPVFVKTKNGTDFRWWLDLNRNGQFEESGFLDANGIRPPNTNSIVGHFSGDPHWIGILERPGLRHAKDNRFIGRYAYIVLPVGKALDVNYIFNNGTNGVYIRDQGFGSWDINLSAFLADLNANEWGAYDYPPTNMPQRLSYLDAEELLLFRYGGVNNLLSSRDVFTNALGPFSIKQLADYDLPSGHWPGSDNPSHFYSPHDIFHGGYFGGFIRHLNFISSNPNPYDRYTYYRMLEQLGTDSAPETDKINLNYRNAVDGVVYANGATDFIPWETTNFFMTISERFLGEVLTNFSWSAKSNQPFAGIPICLGGNTTNVNGRPFYSARIHQLLKIAANIYDATINNPVNTHPNLNFPTIFRPQFRTVNQDVYITGYTQEITTVNFVRQSWRNLSDTNDRPINPDDNVYGIPWIVGARNGWPALSKLALQSVAQLTRKIEISRVDTNSPFMTNQMFIMGLTNELGVQIWNSSRNYFTGSNSLELWVNFTNFSGLTNLSASGNFGNMVQTRSTNFVKKMFFLGFNPSIVPALLGSAQVPLTNQQVVLSNSVIRMNPPRFEPVGANNSYENDLSVYTANWHLTNRMAFALALSYQGQLVDVMSLADLDLDFAISEELNKPMPSQIQAVADLWDTNAFAGVNMGVNYQVQISAGNPPLQDSDWKAFAESPSKQADIDKFNTYINNPGSTTELNQETPFNPRRLMVLTASWEVNDPLLHYTRDDFMRTGSVVTVSATDNYDRITNLLTTLSSSYKPWGGNPANRSAENNPVAFDESVTDANVRNSDSWDFPNQKFPNIGWLGRVHRGTPWQTIYLKSRAAEPQFWLRPDGPGSTMEIHPTNDWRLLDHFTVAQHPNATRGQLSINQTNLAAWSAALSGVEVPTLKSNLVPGIELIVPAAVDPDPNPRLLDIVAAINRKRDQMPGRRFRSLGELLAVKELTSDTPYLSQGLTALQSKPEMEKTLHLTDQDYERIPEQILSLLKVGDERFVIYAWGQSLKPAPNSILTSGGNFGLCTNYQITGEVATRAVVRFTATTNNQGVVNQAVVERFNIMPPE